MTGNLSWDPHFELGPESTEISSQVWPKFLSEPSDISEADLSFEIDEVEFRRRYPAWGLRESFSNRLLAYANAVMVNLDFSTDVLPDRGWEYAIEAGMQPVTPNCLCLVVAVVDPTVQKLGLSKLLIENAKASAKAAGFNSLIAPVRPSHFHEAGTLDFTGYVNSRRSDGAFQDPWLRAHERAGGEKLNICWNSTTVRATPMKWSEWTGQVYAQSGAYPLARGLASLNIDLENNIGIYAEPNVWFRYFLK